MTTTNSTERQPSLPNEIHIDFNGDTYSLVIAVDGVGMAKLGKDGAPNQEPTDSEALEVFVTAAAKLYRQIVAMATAMATQEDALIKSIDLRKIEQRVDLCATTKAEVIDILKAYNLPPISTDDELRDAFKKLFN